MARTLILTVLAALTLGGCAGVIDRCHQALNDLGSNDITRQHHQ
jgi:hypothetical protein